MPETVKELEAQGVQLNQGQMALDGPLELKLNTVTLSSADAALLAAGALTITTTQIKAGLIYLTAPAGSATITTPSAALLRTAFLNRKVGTTLKCRLGNLAAVAGRNLTLAGGSGVTLSPTSIVLIPGESVDLLFRLTAVAVGSATVTVYRVGSSNGSAISMTRAYTVISPPAPLVAGTVNSASTALILNNVALVDGVIALANSGLCTWPRCLRVNIFDTTVTNVLTKGTITIVGTDIDGSAVTEVVGTGQTVPWTDSGGRYWTAVTAHAFASVTSVTASGFVDIDADNKIAVGFVDIFGLPTRIGGTLSGVGFQYENAAAAGATTAKTVGTVNTTYHTVVPASASNGALSFTWVYTYA